MNLYVVAGIMVFAGMVIYLILLKSQTQVYWDFMRRLAALLSSGVRHESSCLVIDCEVNRTPVKITLMTFGGMEPGPDPVGSFLYISCPVKVKGRVKILKSGLERAEGFEQGILEDAVIQSTVRELLLTFKELQVDGEELSATLEGIDYGKTNPQALIEPIQKFAGLAEKMSGVNG